MSYVNQNLRSAWHRVLRLCCSITMTVSDLARAHPAPLRHLGWKTQHLRRKMELQRRLSCGTEKSRFFSLTDGKRFCYPIYRS